MIQPSPSKAIDRATRRQIKEVLLTPQYFWHGAQSETAFLSELYDLNALPSDDPRFKTAYKDIQKHREMNRDWDESWVFDDPRFKIMSSADQTFLEFLAHTLHPRVRTGTDQRLDMLKRLNSLLASSGYELYETTSDTGSDIFGHRSMSMASDIAPLHDRKSRAPFDRKIVGSGAYGHVYSYVDPDYGVPFAVKRARKTLDERELQRFKQEFDALEKLNSPYVVKVYRYDEERNAYSMECCDQTLDDFIKHRTSTLTVDARKRIALQFLQGINHIHSKGYLHRDLSRRNVLVKIYDGDEVVVKISDLGLVKDVESNFTRTGTEMRGTHIDPQLDNFGGFSSENEMYGIGYILQYIFTQRTSLRTDSDEVGRIVKKCTSADVSQRYKMVLDVIADVEALE